MVIFFVLSHVIKQMLHQFNPGSSMSKCRGRDSRVEVAGAGAGAGAGASKRHG